MDAASETPSPDGAPLDVSEFTCVSFDRSRVVVVFEQTNRRYTFFWRGRELRLADPKIEGETGPHAAEVLDCLARAVAYKTVRDAPRGRLEMPSYREQADAGQKAGRFSSAGSGAWPAGHGSTGLCPGHAA